MAELNEILEQANALFDEGKYQEAIPLYDELIEQAEFGAQPIFMKAEALVNLGQHADAVAVYDKALEIDDENALIWNGKGNALYHLDDYAKAHVCFECALDIEPDNFDYKFSAIETALLTGDLEDASLMAQETLHQASESREISIAWTFCIVTFFLAGQFMDALDTLDEFIAHFQEIMHDLIPENDLQAVDYDFCGMEKVLNARFHGASQKILASIIGFLKGDMPIDALAAIKANEGGNVTADDLSEESQSEEPEIETLEDHPNFNAIIDENERRAIEDIEDLIFNFGDNIGFQPFAWLFGNYEWNVDRGPAPFLEELDNRFFIEIEDGHAKRLSIDINVMEAAIEKQRAQDGASSEDSISGKAGAMINLPNLEEIYFTSKRFINIIEAMRAASFGEGHEVDLYVNVDRIPDEQEDLLSLDKEPEISEIDELPVDYQSEGKKLVGSMTWKATK
ncbi:MAG TPA: tetratricopeptide repeat protein [Candidatus Lokiarchaeia archaeon]|nr:tetratricopeptide repeat protein [Candidatus Lokiarchaeia archaeon]